MDNRIESGCSKSRMSLRKEMLSSQHQFSMKTLLQSMRQLCNVTLGQHWKGNDNITEVTFLGFSSSTEDEDLVDKQALAAIDPELSGLLNSLQLHKLKNTEIALLTGLKKHSRTKENTVSQHSPSEMVCVMRHLPASLKFTDSSVFSALSKYTRAIQFSLDGHSALTLHTEDDDTNQSVSSIEDDFVTAFEHLEEEEAGTEHGTAGFDPKHQDSALQAFTLDIAETTIPGDTPQRLAFDQSALPLLQNSQCSRQWSSAKSSVITLSSDPGKQRSFYRQRNAPIFTSSNRHKCVPSVSPSESEDSGGSSPSPVIFLDEEGYQKSLKANLELPQIPILKDDIEDSDSELSEFFDSFDQFDDLSEMLVGTATNLQHGSDPQNLLLRNNSTAKLPSDFTLQQCPTAAAAMNPQRFDQPVLPANVKKPTARKAESPYNNLSDVPDSPRPMNTSGEDSSPLFSPVHSSAFSPLAACGNSEGFGRVGASDTHIYHVLNLGGLSNTSSNDVSNVPHCIKCSVFKYPQTSGSEQRGAAGSTQDIHWSGGFAYLGKPASNENSNMKDSTLPQQKCSNVLKDGIQRIATELVEKSLGGAFKDLQKGVTSCTSTLCHLAARLTSSVIHMALQEIGARQAFARRRTAINCLADYLVGDAISGAFQELEFVKKQIFNNAVARFATDLAEELVFEGIMEVCQFSHPPTPTSITSWSLEDEAKVVSCYARDLSESVLQEAFIELSQVDVTFTPQAAISISLDNIKDVGGEDVTQALKIVNDAVNVKEETLLRHPEGCYTDAVAGKDLDVLHSPEADYKITKALLWVSGILSCVSVPSVVKTLSCDFSDSALHSCCHRVSSKVKLEQAPKSSLAGPGSKSRKVDKVSPVSCVHQLVNQANSANCSGYVFCDTMNLCMEASDCETSTKSEGLDTNEASPTIDMNCQTTVAMLDFVVNNAFDLVTVSKVEYEVEEYASQLSKKILFEPISESPPVSQKHFAAHLAEAIVRNSVDEVKTKAIMPYKDGGSQAGDVETSQAPAARLQEIPEGQMLDQFSVRKLISDRQHQDMCSQSPDLLRTPPVSPNECIPGKHLTIPQHFAQELKGHLAEEFPPCTPPPSPTVGLKNSGVDSTEGVRGPELADSLMSLTEHLQGQALMSTFQTLSADINGPNQELSLGLLGKSRAGLNKDGLFSEERLDHVEGSRSPETPPPTPQQSFHGKSLRSFSRKLKGELAKEFMPVTPPSTPHNHSAPSMAVMTQDTEQKAEFVLKLMRSLSEEVLDNEDDENFDFAERHSESREQPSPRRETKVLEKEELKLDIKRHALHYANQLASSIVSMATEIAAICVEDASKCDASKIRSFRVPPSSLWRSAARSELHTWGSGAEIKFPEEVVGSLWSYAGKVAGEVIRDAKKILSSKKQKVRKFKKDVGQAESSESSYGEQEHVGGEGLNTLADHWSRELADSVHHSPSGSAPGLMSKHSSCESVTDEYAEYIMRMISREGGNGEVIVDHYASKLAFRTVKVGLEQAARRIRQKYKRRLLSCQQSRGEDGTKELLKFLTREDAQDGDLCSRGHDQRLSRKDSRDLTRFAESVAQTITYEVTQKLKTASGLHGLPKSLTDSCLYERSQLEQMAEGLIKKTWTCSIKPVIQRNKRFHSTGSLDNYSHSIDSTNRALEHYVGKSVDSAVQLSIADGALESRKQKECLAYAEKLTEMVLKCSLTDKESRSYINRLSSQTTALCSKNATRTPWLNSKALSKPEHSVHRTVGACQLDVPRIHIELEQRGLFPEDLMSVAIEKAKRDLSNTSLAADSGIGQDGASFTESLAAEIMTSAMISASQSIVSASLKDGMRSSDSTTSQQLSLSVGDDSTGSWSNLSFEDEHPDETSSFLHLSDSNGNSSSWSSLGLEGDIYEENISFPPSDSDNSEDREEEVQEDSEGMMQVKEILSILNIDLEPCSHDPQMRAVLQWIAASQSPVSLVYFKECYENELLHFPAVVRRAEVRGWKVCDLLQAVLRYCNDVEQHPTGGRYIRTPLFDWLLENT
ncbi:A-kinase anchor protein 11 isoform X1 [Chiloscyllium plagiosum]|uniref:A-kinase anchor protein 11 isoform X1 n=1 Tax=Chiloscyllium plagiosum TaxID=36176 RepID=UPI001CB811E5|nr:A-kinase anchor protein 11 isoform X1 [Chiloscyllium plagiosum]XP_043550365.1 A-kinase anchor protein 11 isoform X1 [Chiloscyllium plagiosum]XP_043550366.1 A-kinase anchor protein 11 isoform X1 [Chiloscyllium plagiosum]XP_043550367.1 A-kinase anchor protein 11 isoform X1 [Chiloscyllium plagiosum]XP_043550371.1 A-kinase anchor protein 11 isoform X1 [Chiloscyllium plagiosum]XP_043550372.1 A-kinase anchor protein 11 isoform X1 [Chiloscyllium plagiosum]XP_043550373.1 A-kinase anchor protein 11